MKHREGMVFVLALVLSLMAGSQAGGASQTVRLVVEADYFADGRNGENGLIHGRFPLRRPLRPFRAIAGRLMRYAGVRLLSGAEDAEGTLRIEAEGVALGTLYDFMENRMRLRHLRFTGVTIEGRVSLASKPAGLTCAAGFAGTIASRKGGIIVGVWDYRESPQFAPFEKALAEPGSFVAALTAIIGAVHGPAPLSAALADPDAAVARYARMALDRLEGGETSSPAVAIPIVECVTP